MHDNLVTAVLIYFVRLTSNAASIAAIEILTAVQKSIRILVIIFFFAMVR